jgi:uncharacterized membrane protein YphA (DoxX/SURF4 family)
MRYKKCFDTILRIWLGAFLLKNSVVGFLTPLESLGLPPDIYAFIKSLWDTGFMMHLVKAIEFLCGVALVTNYFVPLALALFAPVLVNIYGLHVFVFHAYVTSGLYMILAVSYLIWKDREIFKPLARPRLRQGFVN